jgi:ribonuclease P protein component
MKYSEALKKNEDFKEIYRTGKSYANKYLIMYVKNNNTNSNRIGISVSKKVGNSVIRHRITRLIRESYRLSEDNFVNGLDIIVVARVGAKGKDYSEIQSALLHLMKLHKIGKETSKI